MKAQSTWCLRDRQQAFSSLCRGDTCKHFNKKRGILSFPSLSPTVVLGALKIALNQARKYTHSELCFRVSSYLLMSHFMSSED